MLPGDSKYCSRHTIYIGRDGKILYVDEGVKPATAGDDVAARLKELGIARTP